MVYTGTMIEELIAAVEREERRLASGNEQACESSETTAEDPTYCADDPQLPLCAEIQFAQTA